MDPLSVSSWYCVVGHESYSFRGLRRWMFRHRTGFLFDEPMLRLTRYRRQEGLDEESI